MTDPNLVRRIFLEALDQPESSRENYLAAIPALDTRVLDDVRQLLAYQSDTGFTLNPAAWFGEEDPQPEAIGSYQVLGILGRGGMGVVYLARDPADGREVAIKVLRAGLETAASRVRFQREIDMLRRLDHPGIARMLDAGEMPGRDGRPARPYLVLEYIEGQSLRQYLVENRGSPRERLDLLVTVCEAVDHAHRQGILHRDLKPENIRVDASGRPRVLDFGVARATGAGVPQLTLLTEAGQLVGTLGYMSPEQLRADPAELDARSDVYSLGVLAYEMVCGVAPHASSTRSIHTLIVAILTEEPRRPGTVVEGVAPELESILERALAKDPDDRYATAAEFGQDLRRFLKGEVPEALSLRSRRVRAGRLARVRRWGWIAAGLVVLLTVVGMALRQALGDRRITPEEAYARILPAQRLLHIGERTDAGTREAIEILESVERDLSFLKSDSLATQIRMLVLWRLGEADYFLGSDHDDLGLLTRAWEHFNEAYLLPVYPEVRQRLDLRNPVARDVARFPGHRALSGRGLASAALASFEAPRRHHRNALDERAKALAVYQGLFGPNYSVQNAQVDAATDLGMLRNELGESWSALADIVDSLEYASRALEVLAPVDTIALFQGWGPPYASFLQNYGIAFRQLGEGRGEPALLDSAEARFVRALELRTPARSPGGYARTQIQRARVWVARAGLEGDSAAKAGALEQGLGVLAAARSALGDAVSPRTSLRLSREEAVIESRLGALRRDAGVLQTALARLEAVAQDLESTRRLVEVAEVQGEIATTARMLWELEGDPESRSRAGSALDRAGALVTAAQYPALHRRLEDERRRLGD